MRGGIVAVYAAAENGHRRPLRFERPAMRVGVDPAGEAADDDEAHGR
jgi:hypothetical protein